LYYIDMYRERHNPVRLFGKRLLLLALFAGAVLLVPGVWKVYTQERESRILKNEATQELSELQGREELLRARTEALDTEYGLETVLREQFSLAREGEKLIVIVNRPPQEITAENNSYLANWFTQLLHW